MARVSSTIDVGALQRGDQILGMVGIQPVLVPTLNKIDIDPDQLLQTLDVYRQAVEDVRAAGAAIDQPVGGEDCWEGEGQQQAEEYRECVAKWWQQILDFLLGIVDWLVQLIDWILDAVWLICQFLVWLAGWLAAIVTVIAIILIVTSAGIGAVLLPILKVVYAILGAVAALSFILGALLKLLDYLIEWLQDLIRKGRDALCGGGIIPRSDDFDWDPDPLPLPTWPFD